MEIKINGDSKNISIFLSVVGSCLLIMGSLGAYIFKQFNRRLERLEDYLIGKRKK